MALSAVNRGAATNTTSSITFNLNPPNNFTSNTFAVLALAYDNSGGGGSDPFTSLTDSSGNTWTLRQSSLNDPGASSAGVAMRIYTSPISTLTTSTLIQIGFQQAVPVKAYTFLEVSSDVGSVQYNTGGQTTGSGTTQTITTSAAVSTGELVFGVLGQEGNGTRTQDSDTLNGSWSTAQSAGAGTTTAGIEIISQYKILTAGGAQTYNPTASPIGDWCMAWISLSEFIPPVSESFDPMGMMGFFGI